MERPLLNQNQRRRVGAHLRLLLEDLEDVGSWPEMARPGEPYAAIRDVMSRLREAVEALRSGLSLPPDNSPPLRRRVMATSEVWATSMEDITARQLRAYGSVHPDLGGVLGPRIDEIVGLLQRMTDLAERLPDR